MVNRGRHARLLKLLANHESLSVEQLVGMLHASTPTIRRELAWLASRNLLTRTRGGATHRQPDVHCLPPVSTSFANRLNDNLASKRAIARYAAGMCEDGSSVIINGGTTTFMMAEFLTGKHLRVLTNSFLIARDLLDFSASEVMLLGGTLYREQQLMMSLFDSGIAHQHDSAKIFMGISALSPRGLMEADPLLI
jgi:DeoR family ulaG and ulaABCDEF operon transcriptional repressor